MTARKSSLAAALAGLAVGLGACGGQSRSTSASASTSTAATTSTTKSRPAASTPARTTPTTATATTLTAAAPPPAGTAAAPDGLRPSIGYGSYDNCTTCSGAVPASLRRPLHLSAASSGSCPVSGGGGPVTASPTGTLSASPFLKSAWAAARATWSAASSYGGPVLIRGRQLDGPHAVGFGVGHVPYDELQLPAGGPRQWPTFTRVRGPGCYAYQVDGTSFSTIVVFRVAMSG